MSTIARRGAEVVSTLKRSWRIFRVGGDALAIAWIVYGIFASVLIFSSLHARKVSDEAAAELAEARIDLERLEAREALLMDVIRQLRHGEID